MAEQEDIRYRVEFSDQGYLSKLSAKFGHPKADILSKALTYGFYALHNLPANYFEEVEVISPIDILPIPSELRARMIVLEADLEVTLDSLFTQILEAGVSALEINNTQPHHSTDLSWSSAGLEVVPESHMDFRQN